MTEKFWMTATALAAVVLMMGAASADSEFLTHGRVSFDTGTAMVKNASEDSWSAAVVNTLVLPGDTLWVDQSGTAELELAGASFLRLADGSKAEVVSLPPNAYIRGWAGSFYVHRLTRSQGDFIFTTPSATVEIPADAMVRLDIDASGAMTVSVRWGSAKVRTDQGGDVLARDSMRVWVDPGMLPSDPTPFDRAATDAFDTWNNDRARVLADGLRTTPKDVVLQDTTVGSYDLARYGEWVYVDSRPYWRPTVAVNYVPYRYGYWNYMPAMGHVWVDEYPFAYVTSHYGRWRHTGTYGWIWSYDPVWSPAWVASVRVGDYYAWSPVDYYHRPVMVTGGMSFMVGGISFCSYSTSYVRGSYLYAGPRHVYAPTTVIINNFTSAPTRSVNVWNVAHDRRYRPSVPYDSRLIAGERDYSPRRSIRGGQGDWVKELAPSDRVRRLEANLGRTEFASTSRVSPGLNARTAISADARKANTRQVRLERTEQTYLAAEVRDRAGTAASRTPFVTESTRLGTVPGEGRLTARSASPTAEPVRDRSRENAPAASPRTDAPTSRPEGATVRSTPPTTGRGDMPTRDHNESNRVALRDMESGAPAPRTMPRTGIAPERTAPAPTVRRESTPMQRTAPAPTPAPTVRRESTPMQRTAPAPTPTVRRESAPMQRTAPAPTPTPTVRRESAPIQRTAPAPTPTVRRESAPMQRNAPAPAPSVRRESAPVMRNTPAPAPSVRRESAPMMRNTPAPAPTRSMPAPRSGSVAPRPSSGVSSNRGALSSPQRPQMPSAPAGSGARGRR